MSERTMLIRPRRLATLGLGLLAAATLAACGSTPAKSGSPTTDGTATTNVATTASPTATTAPASYSATGPSAATLASSHAVTVGGKSVTVPTDSGKAITAEVDDGQQIIISVGGFLPKRLYSSPSEPLVWTNLTNQPQQVIFDHFAVKSPVLPPGGTFSWSTAASESISYHSASGMHGVITINPPGV
jgi:hypothetical protein